ncbi:RING-finger-containing E3 ubiquitin ligase, putative [Phytophthora infestans T30-4]|uniref:RBR-type E3 ubiquitin transferase n=1 Tax=Phytophthora infestans (strain T30-4) TaxID=403677 RepID=D0NFT6_PHYIT|nr:RING-finger-containing E3 ubiquitin ligase, putative [Phytophthora infestans T30-4]EEY57137.1 RING-finger-containing E3 ubiquitin ligase, putative [Phytophthora infestans T30-4]|eukprot:XP_002901747.1 RING-finger-containing E3 ubiquitin ligase, putative [Phytophthora infestans T30-4]
MQLAASIRERVTLLSDLHSSLCHLHSFSGEDERMRWRWRLHQLQRQHNLEQQDAQITSLLAAIENQISALPIESDGRSIPIMENEVLATMEETRRGGWGRLSRFARAASGHTLGALTRSNVRDRGRSVPLTRMSMRELNAEVRDDGDDISSLTAYRRQESNSLSHSVPSLFRSMASYLGLSMEETFLCQICYDYAPMKTSYALSVCGHLFCEACLRNYLEFKIKEGQVYPKCFFEISEDKTACNAEIAVDDIQSLVSDGVWQKHNKFKFNKEHELARQCPYCDHSQLCAGSDHPECVCEACNREFCFVHSSAHQGHSCAEYDKKMIAVEKLNNALISKISKPCPGCQNNVEKTGGCNQMKCVVCTTSFCWICLKVIDDTVFPEHFQWWNVRGCAGNQMADIEGQGSTQKGVGIVMRIIFFVIFGPPALVMAVVFSVLCCCFLPCTAHARLTFRQAFTTCFCVSGYILLAPIVLALGLAALGVFIGGAAAGAAVLVSRRSGVGETATARDIEDTNDQSPSDQTFFRVST